MLTYLKFLKDFGPNLKVIKLGEIQWKKTEIFRTINLESDFFSLSTTHFYPLWTIYFCWPSTFFSTLLIFHFFYFATAHFQPWRPPNSCLYHKGFIPYRFRPSTLWIQVHFRRSFTFSNSWSSSNPCLP